MIEYAGVKYKEFDSRLGPTDDEEKISEYLELLDENSESNYDMLWTAGGVVLLYNHKDIDHPEDVV